jgi:hypothetical protein
VRHKAGSFTWLGWAARSQLASCGLTLCRIALTGRRYTVAMSVIVVRVRIRWQPADTAIKLRARSRIMRVRCFLNVRIS